MIISFALIERPGILPTLALHYKQKCLNYFLTEQCQTNLYFLCFFFCFLSWRFFLKIAEQNPGVWL